MKFLPCCLSAALTLTMFAVGISAQGATITWDNPAGGEWATAANWSPQQVPGASDVAVINGTTAFTVTATGTRSVSGMVLENPNATLLLLGRTGTSSSTLTVANGFENFGTIELTTQDSTFAATLNVTSGALTNAVGGLIRVLEGTAGNRTLGLELDNRGTLQIERSTSLNKSGAKHRFAGTVNLAAGTTLTVGAGGLTETTHAGANWTGTGTLDLPGSRPFILETDFTLATVTLTLQNVTVQGPGTFTVPAGRTLTFQSTTMTAPLHLLGTLENWTTSSIDSPFSVPAGAFVRLLGRTGTSSSSLTVANGFENFGTIELTTQDSTFAATLNVTSGALTNAVGGLIRVLEGTAGNRTLGLELDNRGTLQIERSTSLNKSGAKHRFAGTVNLAAGTTLTVGAGGLTETTHAGANWTGTGTLDLPGSRPFILETDFTMATVTLTLQNVTVQGPGTFTVPAGRTLTFQSTTMTAPLQLLGTLENWTTSSIDSPFSVPAGAFVRLLGRTGSSSSTLTVANGFENFGTIELTTQDSTFAATLNVTSGALTNAVGGLIRVLEGTAGNRTLGLELDNRGTLQIERSTSLNKSGAKHRNSGLIDVRAGELTLSQAGTGASFTNDGELRVLAGATFRPTAGNWTNALTGILSGAGTFNLTAGTLANLGTVSPGTSPGILGVTANYPQTAGATLSLEIGGFTPGSEHDQLAVSAAANLDGTVRAALINDFAPKKDDAFTVLTYASRNGSFATLESAEPDRIAWEVQYGPTSAQLVVLNSAPTLTTIGNQTVSELSQLSVTASASDQDLPAQTLTYSLTTAPTGMTINPSSGQITWTPTEAQGPGNYDVTVRVADNGTPALAHTTSFSVAVNEVNVAPQLALPGPQGVNEQVELLFTINGSDSDLPANALTYELVSGPPGASFNPTTREFRWTPTEAQGPGNFTATFRVTDNNPDAVNTQQLTAEGGVSIAVAEVNRQPTLTTINNQTATEEALFSYTATATDPDLPANGLTYSLDTFPTGMTINPSSGLISWTPTEAQGPGNFDVTVRVTDNGTPALFHTTSFSVAVSEANLAPTLTAVANDVVHAGTPFTLQLSATDPDQPANTFTYSLVTGPTGATVSPSGVVNWSVPTSAAFTQASFTVRVTDNGTPALSDDEDFQLTITGTLAVLTSVRTGDQLAITWRSIPGKTYRLVTSDTLPATQWDDVPGDVPATAGTASKTVTIGTIPPASYFLVEQLGD